MNVDDFKRAAAIVRYDHGCARVLIFGDNSEINVMLGKADLRCASAKPNCRKPGARAEERCNPERNEPLKSQLHTAVLEWFSYGHEMRETEQRTLLVDRTAGTYDLGPRARRLRTRDLALRRHKKNTTMPTKRTPKLIRINGKCPSGSSGVPAPGGEPSAQTRYCWHDSEGS